MASSQIVLVGLPGSGKSTVGPILAVKLGWSFVDLDVRIENDTGMQIAEIFLNRGEAEFRRIESALTVKLAAEPNLVLAPGGGWIIHNELPAALMVWLRVSPARAVERLGERAADRPLLQPDPLKKMNELLAAREPFYKKADITIDTDEMTPSAIAVAIVNAIERHGNEK